MVRYGLEWLQMALDGFRWLEMVADGLRWLQRVEVMTTNGW